MIAAWAALSTPSARGASAARELSAIYQPFRVEHAAIAPDGRNVAFIVREGRRLEVQIFDIDKAGERKRHPLDARPAAQPRFLAWASSEQVVAASDAPGILTLDRVSGAGRMLIDAKTFAGENTSGRRSVRVLGLTSDDPESVMIDVTGPTGTGDMLLELYRLNVRTAERQRIHVAELELPGGSLLIDQQGMARVLFSRASIPQRFNYRPPISGNSGWKNLDRVVNDTKLFASQITPQNFLGERSIPIGFDHDPHILYFASNIDRDTYGLYALDLRTGRRTDFVVEDPEFDLVELTSPWRQSPLIFDRARRILVGIRRDGLEPGTRWLDREIGGIQATIEKKFPGRHVKLLEWDDARQRFLSLVSSHGDPGRYFVYHRAEGRCVEYLRRASGLAPEVLSRSESFAFVIPASGRVSGYLTLPRTPPVTKPALLVWLHDGPWQRIAPGFNRDAQALAAMGFVVAQIDYSGSSGFGRMRRESIRPGFDTRPLEDVLATIEWLEGSHSFDRKRIAVIGEGFGGYLALRALQLHPDAFRCAVAVNAAVELGDLLRSAAAEERSRREFEQENLNRPLLLSPEEREAASESRMMARMAAPLPPVDFERGHFRWFFGETSGLGRISVLRNPDLITKPVLLLHDPRHPYAPLASVKELRDTLERSKRPVAFAAISPQFALGGLNARSQVMRRVGEFLNVTLYDFDVKIGEAREKEKE